MALNIAKLVGRSFCLSNNYAWNHVFASGCRTLYSKSSIGVDKYELARASYKRQLVNLEESFRSRMKEFTQLDDSTIFSEDLKTMLHIIDKTPEDIQLLTKMLQKYNIQKKQLRFANFVFGPVVMRTLYYLDEPEVALKMYTDPEAGTMYDQISSGHILLDLLFNHGKYQEVIDAFTFMTSKSLPGIAFPKNPSVVAVAACNKLNTRESYETALNIIKSSDEKSVPIPRRGILMVCHLAVKQNAPQVALEILSRLRSQQYITTRCLKVMAYAMVGRFAEILLILRQGTSLDNPMSQKFGYHTDVINVLEEALEKANMGPDTEIFQLVQHIKNTGNVEEDTLENHLFREIVNDTRFSTKFSNDLGSTPYSSRKYEAMQNTR